MRRYAAPLLALLAVGCGDGSTDPTSGPPARLVGLTPSDQTAVVGEAVSVAPTVLVTNANNQPLRGITVIFAVTGGGGSVAPTTVTTDARGEAQTTWTVGNAFVQNTLVATVFGLPTVTFTARGVAPTVPILAFSLPDAASDTLGSGTFTARAHDLLSLRGDFKRDSLIVTLSFAAPVAPSRELAANSVGGRVEFDIDDNVTTGASPFSNIFGASASLGVDYALDLFAATSTSAEIFSAETLDFTVVPASFSGATVVVRIPMSVLGNDDGNFGLVGVIGTSDRPTDVFPNSGQTTARRSVGVGDDRFHQVSPWRSFAPIALTRSLVQEVWRTGSERERPTTK